jgi:hypothetical protein
MRNVILVAAGFSFTLLQSQTIDDGRRQTRNEQYEDAGKTFELLMAKKPKNGELYYWAGVNLLEAGDSTSAKAMFEKGLAMAPTYHLLNVGLGHLELRNGNETEAQNRFTLAMKAGKKMANVVNREIGRAYLLLPYASPAKMKEYAQKAAAALQKCAETDYEAQLLLGDAYVITTPEDASKAIEQYTISSILSSSDPRSKLRQARVYQRVGNYDVALNQVNEALMIDREFAPAYRQKADVFNMNRLRDSTVYYYQLYLKRNNNLSARRMYAQALYLAKDYDAAIAEANNIINEQKAAGKPVFANLYGIIAYSYADKNDTARATNETGLSYFDLYENEFVKKQKRALSLSENYVKANLLARLGRIDEAFVLHQLVLSDTAACPERFYQQVQDFYNSRKQYERVIAVLELKKMKLKTLGRVDVFQLAQAQTNLKQYSQALLNYQQLIVLDSNYIQGYYKIATTYEYMDPNDSLGYATKAYERWLNRLNAEQKAKYKQTMVSAYNSMQFFARKRKDYESVSNYLGKIIELVPDDEATITEKARVDDYLKKIAAKNKPAAKTDNNKAKGVNK